MKSCDEETLLYATFCLRLLDYYYYYALSYLSNAVVERQKKTKLNLGAASVKRLLLFFCFSPFHRNNYLASIYNNIFFYSFNYNIILLQQQYNIITFFPCSWALFRGGHPHALMPT